METGEEWSRVLQLKVVVDEILAQSGVGDGYQEIVSAEFVGTCCLGVAVVGDSVGREILELEF